MEGDYLYNPQLETFITAAEEGSFSKAAEKGHITPTAVIKQINALESHLGFPLFLRTHRGIILTEAGTSLYKDVKYLIQYCRDSAMRARETQQAALIRVGTSPMTPGKFLMDLWPAVHGLLPDLSIQLVPFDNTPEHAREILTRLGERIDVVADVYDGPTLARWNCRALKIKDFPLRLAMSYRHPLTTKRELTMDDLAGETVWIIHQGWHTAMDQLRQDLSARKNIRIHTFDFYRTEIFNRAEQENALLAAADLWQDVHPLMKLTPLRSPYAMAYGLLYSPHPSGNVSQFISALKRIM